MELRHRGSDPRGGSSDSAHGRRSPVRLQLRRPGRIPEHGPPTLAGGDTAMTNSLRLCVVLALSSVLALPAVGQDVAPPLTMQGLNQVTIPGARAMGMGGSSVASAGDAMSLFSNPALVGFLPGPEIRLGARVAKTTFSQNQEWLPNELFAEFSLLFEQNPATVVKPFDDIP